MKQMFIKNLRQANFFLAQGVSPCKVSVEKGLMTLIFDRTEECEKAFTKWIETKAKGRTSDK